MLCSHGCSAKEARAAVAAAAVVVVALAPRPLVVGALPTEVDMLISMYLTSETIINQMSIIQM